MPAPPYCTADKDKAYFSVLRFARLSKADEISDDETANEAVNYLNTLKDTGIRALYPLVPSIYHNILKHDLQHKLHQDVLNRLRESSLASIARDITHQQWIENIAGLFDREAIPIILLKGAAFAHTLYPGNTPRPGVDIDLLVRKADFEAACTLLSEIMKPIVLSAERLATHETLFERSFEPKNKGGGTVEIHRGLTNPYIFNIDEENLWDQSRKHPAYSSEAVRILSPEDTLLHLAVHAFRDLDFCTHNLLDVHEAWCQWKPDSVLLSKKARQWGAAQVLYYLLQNARTVLNTPVPETLLALIQPRRIRDSINKKILCCGNPNTLLRKNFGHRATQLISQIALPDHPSKGLRFQAHYLRMRMRDWYLNKRG